MENHHPSDQIKQRTSYYLQQFKSTYSELLKGSISVIDATHFTHDSIEHQIAQIPILSHLFQSLKRLHNYHLQLFSTWTFEQFNEQFEALKEQSNQDLEAALLALTSGSPRAYDALPVHYRHLLSSNHTLTEIISDEQKVLNMTAEDLFELLAYHQALILFKAELDEKEQTIILKSSIPEPKFGFTRSQQTLVFHYLLTASGVRPRAGANISDCAMLLHQLLGLPVSDIANSDIYKKLKRPIDHSSPSKMIQNLLLIRPFFDALPHKPIVDLIDKDLNLLFNSQQKG
ncbi:hypothetical protein [Fluviicola sp.]|uniref:hypothetical protein n=1 Tax=Fluviicola sp. TaxID=1917219 RepID=UPI003D29193E